jgi:hypothetical protein
MKRGVSGLFPKLLGFGVKKLWRIRFSKEEKAEDLDDTIGNGGRPKSPPPAGVFGNETPSNWTYSWSK